MMRYPMIAARLFNVPLMAQSAVALTFADVFLSLASIDRAPTQPLMVSEVGSLTPEAYSSRYAGTRFKAKRYTVTDSGVGILPVYGAMVHRMGQLSPDCMEMLSYEKLSWAFDSMVTDPDVRAILLEIDSPGGEATGNIELARRILGARNVKPVWAHANEHAYSAAYSIGAAASKLFAPDTGEVGSIGVIFLHKNMTERDAQLGYEYTAFYSGARKNDFNPHFKLSEEARASATAVVNRMHNILAEHVAQARGITVEAVNATQSGTFDADRALAGGFIDGIATFADTLRMLESALPRAPGVSSSAPKVSPINTSGKTPAIHAAAAPENTIDAEVIFAARRLAIEGSRPAGAGSPKERTMQAYKENASVTESDVAAVFARRRPGGMPAAHVDTDSVRSTESAPGSCDYASIYAARRLGSAVSSDQVRAVRPAPTSVGEIDAAAIYEARRTQAEQHREVSGLSETHEVVSLPDHPAGVVTLDPAAIFARRSNKDRAP